MDFVFVLENLGQGLWIQSLKS